MINAMLASASSSSSSQPASSGGGAQQFVSSQRRWIVAALTAVSVVAILAFAGFRAESEVHLVVAAKTNHERDDNNREADRGSPGDDGDLGDQRSNDPSTPAQPRRRGGGIGALLTPPRELRALPDPLETCSRGADILVNSTYLQGFHPMDSSIDNLIPPLTHMG